MRVFFHLPDVLSQRMSAWMFSQSNILSWSHKHRQYQLIYFLLTYQMQARLRGITLRYLIRSATKLTEME
ncbi:MAG: hypothetical protein KDC31_00910 [Saprospiraceae bacterium]|nr:hypothetical protein [Saprospiraceae bacterium]HMX77533.1 hypothetical protein [Chitinophagaceae bacterium]MBX7178918.1 hypothetical protein [Saprospiraceae bacterium]MCB0589826.1 hypothetical protein [Saprospiraceae bacterium]MCO5284274.1 hypothetical protein [Saprospiraceae bacterium]